MTTVKEYTCKTCDALGAYVRPAPGDYTGRGSFTHLGADEFAGHTFEPKPQCPKCKSFDYVHDETDPWANYDRCGSCGHTERFSLGD
jgi:hypothetical protein